MKINKYIINKLTLVFYASVLSVIDHVFITLSLDSNCGSADYFDNVMTKFVVNNRTDALKICFLR